MKHFFTFLFLFGAFAAFSQEEARAKAVKEAAAKAELGWKKGGSFGLDLSGLGLFNPKVGSGGNRLGFTVVSGFFANQKTEKTFWSNRLDVQLGVQRVEVPDPSGPKPVRRDNLKNLDVLRFQSQYGYAIVGDKLFVGADLFAQTLMVPAYSGNALNPVTPDDKVIAKFLNPLTVDVAPGLIWTPDAHWSVFFSPAALRYIVMSDQAIVDQYLHVSKEALTGDNYFLGLGAKVRAAYNNKFLKERVAFGSNLLLYSNYLSDPGNIDVLWTNALDFQIIKGLSLGLLGELFYDHDVNVQIDRNDNRVFGEKGIPGQNDELAPAASLTGAFLLKYTRIF